jgi:hypothetical protein
VVRRYAWSRNLVNEGALVHWGLSRQKQTKPQRSVRDWLSYNDIKYIFPLLNVGICGSEYLATCIVTLNTGWILIGQPQALATLPTNISARIALLAGIVPNINSGMCSRAHRQSLEGRKFSWLSLNLILTDLSTKNILSDPRGGFLRIGFTPFGDGVLSQWCKTLSWIFHRILCLFVDHFMTLPVAQVT